MFQTVGKLFCINGLDFFKFFLIAELRWNILVQYLQITEEMFV